MIFLKENLELAQKSFPLHEGNFETEQWQNRPLVSGFAIDSERVVDPEQIFQIEWDDDTKQACTIWLSFSDGDLFVEKDSEIDMQARKQGVTFYFEETDESGDDRRLMLPYEITFEKAPLLPGVLKPAMTVECHLDMTSAAVSNLKIYPSKVQSSAQISFNEASRLIDEDLPHPVIENLSDYHKVAQVLWHRWGTEPNAAYSSGRNTVTVFMRLANELVATWSKERRVPIFTTIKTTTDGHIELAKITAPLRNYIALMSWRNIKAVLETPRLHGSQLPHQKKEFDAMYDLFKQYQSEKELDRKYHSEFDFSTLKYEEMTTILVACTRVRSIDRSRFLQPNIALIESGEIALTKSVAENILFGGVDNQGWPELYPYAVEWFEQNQDALTHVSKTLDYQTLNVMVQKGKIEKNDNGFTLNWKVTYQGSEYSKTFQSNSPKEIVQHANIWLLQVLRGTKND